MSEPAAITVLVVDDHPVVRRGIVALLSTEPGLEVAGEAADGREAIEQAAALHPDVILMDLLMPGMGGIEAIAAIRDAQPGVRVVVLTSFGSDADIFPAIKAGAIGYLLKNASASELLRAVRRAATGQSSLDSMVAQRLMNEVTGGGSPAVAAEQLSRREIEVLKLVAHGDTNEAIAEALGISEATVRTHVSNLLAKLHLPNRTQAALYAVRIGLVPIQDGGGE
jgi:NarL family two-component system response regulator LiaR